MKLRCDFTSPLLIALALITQLPAPAAQARALRIDEMSTSEFATAKTLAETEVKQELAQNTMTHLYEAAGKTTEPPMSRETRDRLAKGAYMLVASSLAAEGVHISEYEFTRKVGTMLDRMASYGLYPQAFTVGYMARYQVVAGGSVGTQFNFYVEKGDLKMSSYSMYGAQIGTAAQTKIQFYASLCFGTCFGGDHKGWFVGTDVSGGLGAGIDGFLEFGLDFTDLLKAGRNGKPYSLKELWESKAVYAGVGFDIGVGGGISIDVTYYSQDFEKVLSPAKPSGKPFSPRVMSQYRLRP